MSPYTVLGYVPMIGRSYFRIQCSCGAIVTLYCWSGTKACYRCRTRYYYQNGEVRTAEELGLASGSH